MRTRSGVIRTSIIFSVLMLFLTFAAALPMAARAAPTDAHDPHEHPGGATCVGADPCRACSNCSRCRHCNAGGGTCGVCKASGVSAPTQVAPATAPQRELAPSSGAPLATPSLPQLPKSVRYQVVSTERKDAGAARRNTATVVVPAGMSRAEIDANLRLAAKVIYARDPVDALQVFAYREGTDTRGRYSAGRVTFAPGGDWDKARAGTPPERFQTVVELREFYFSKPAGNPELEKRGMDERTRRAIYAEMITAQRRAQAAAEKAHPAADGTASIASTTERRNALADTLEAKHRGELYARYGLTDADLSAIDAEGTREYWPWEESANATMEPPKAGDAPGTPSSPSPASAVPAPVTGVKSIFVLRSGSTITGTLLGSEGGVYRIKHEQGTSFVDASQVQSVTPVP